MVVPQPFAEGLRQAVGGSPDPSSLIAALASGSIGGGLGPALAQVLGPQASLPQTFAPGSSNITTGSTINNTTGGNVTASFSPTNHNYGGGGAPSGQDFAKFKSWVGQTFRNGNIMPPRTS
jgi:hypothetical protein